MSSNYVSIPHKLGRDAAKTRLQQGLARLRAEFARYIGSVEEIWTDPYSLDIKVVVMGASVAASVFVADTTVDVTTKLPLLLRMWRGQVDRYLLSYGPAFFASNR